MSECMAHDMFLSFDKMQQAQIMQEQQAVIEKLTTERDNLLWLFQMEWLANNPDVPMPDFVMMAKARRAAVAGVGQTIDQILAQMLPSKGS